MQNIKWIKKGCIFDISNDWGKDLGYSHCHKPTPILIDDNTIRVYYGLRGAMNRTRVSFVDLNADDLSIKYVHKDVILDIGKLGTFDDSGAQVCSVVRVDNHTIYMYYIGWNTSTTVPSRNSLGLAVSYDNGIHFERMYEGPILERYLNEPYHVGASDIKFIDGQWKMWYNSGNGFVVVNGKPEYTLHIKYATSDDGIIWNRHNIVCVEKAYENEIIGRPSVLVRDGKYHMFYSRRDIVDFRTDKDKSYKMGYAESIDGIKWQRMDNIPSLEVSEDPNDWDSQMIAYPYIIEVKGKLIAFYNGNAFGKTGFGAAEMIIEK